MTDDSHLCQGVGRILLLKMDTESPDRREKDLTVLACGCGIWEEGAVCNL